jgi:hypothetical protein
MSYQNKLINNSIFKDYIKKSEKKNIDCDLFDAVRHIFYNYKSIEQNKKYYNNEKVLLPLILHENYYKDIFNRLNTNIIGKENIEELIMKISDSISNGDLIETNIYSEQNWHLQNMHNFASCIVPCQLLNSTGHYNCLNDLKYKMSFSTELNKTSLKNINRKNITNINMALSDNLDDYLNMGKIINHLINKQNYKELHKLYEYFQTINPVFAAKLIEILVKIDKTNTKYNNLTTKIKKKIINYSKN